MIMLKFDHCFKCGEPTQEGKPYCINHLHLMRYVADLMKRIKQEEGK